MLGELSNPPGAIHKRIRRGRGPSSGKGKTSGRGHKGQKARGQAKPNFIGGQTLDEIVNPPRGTGNLNRHANLAIVNLDRIQLWIDQGRLDPSKPITFVELLRSRCIHQVKEGVKLLARSSAPFKSPINITVSRASSSAIAAIEKAGGTVTARYYNRFSIGQVLEGTMHPTVSLRSHPDVQPVGLQPQHGLSDAELEQFPIPPAAQIKPDAETGFAKLPDGTTLPAHPEYANLQRLRQPFRFRLPDPSSRSDLEYYRDGRTNGYLQYEVGKDESASLYFAKYEPVVKDGMLDVSGPVMAKVRDDIKTRKSKGKGKSGRSATATPEGGNLMFNVR